MTVSVGDERQQTTKLRTGLTHTLNSCSGDYLHYIIETRTVSFVKFNMVMQFTLYKWFMLRILLRITPQLQLSYINMQPLQMKLVL